MVLTHPATTTIRETWIQFVPPGSVLVRLSPDSCGHLESEVAVGNASSICYSPYLAGFQINSFLKERKHQIRKIKLFEIFISHGMQMTMALQYRLSIPYPKCSRPELFQKVSGLG